MVVDSVRTFATILQSYHLLDSPQLAEATGPLAARFPNPKSLAGELIQRGWLTPFQVNQIFQGRAGDLLLESYVLLERLGEGGMGQVFKARNWKLDRLVALKLIRKERLNNAEVVRRFQREVRAAAQLNHPNVVHAYDCGESGDRHFYVMEYVDGIDLAQLVRRDGPLAVEQACDCIRQAALGLQHAFERGLVHRDIKPHNLLLTGASGDGASTGGVVKILDMGLARLSQPADESESTSTVTETGIVMGTLDYMAPEQALDAHSADIRADLYSLGCTFYFLLTGQVPFPGGSSTAKLLRHQTEQPTPVEQLRTDTPSAVAAIVSKLMAKRAEDRYQTPAEAAAVLSQLESLDETVEYQGSLPPSSAASGRAPATEATLDTSPSWSSLVAPADSAEVVAASDQRRRAVRPRGRKLLFAGAIGVLALLASLPFLFRREKPPAEQAPSVAEQKPHEEKPPPTFDEWIQQTAELPADRQVKEVAAMLKKRNPGFDGKVTPTIKGDAVIGFEFHSEIVLDLRPLRALPHLQSLICPGSRDNPGKLSSLSPLKGMKLTALNCSFTRVADLAPLRGMPLKWLHCAFTNITDLTPLQGMKLAILNLNGNAQIKDLSPLRGMPLTTLMCLSTSVTDLAPIRDMPLITLSCPLPTLKDHATLRSLKDLKQINRRPIAAFWKEAGKTTPSPKGRK